MNVAGILSTKGSYVATIGPTAPIHEAVAALHRWGVGALVVSPDGHQIAGLLSERDIVRALADSGGDTLDRPVQELMTVELHTCGTTDRVERLMSLMTDHRIRHVPVVDDAGELIGLVSIGDVVKNRVQELEEEQAQLIDYVRTGR